MTENPISENGKWINGAAVGLDWHDIQTTPGEAFGADIVGGYDDDIAHLSAAFATFDANQYAEGTVYRVSGYSPGSSHEIELLLRFQISANDARGYEVLWGHAGNGAIVRWNGPAGDYTPLLDNQSWGAAVDGDELRAEISGNIITVEKNGSEIGSVDITSAGGAVWSTGQPGMGFWPQGSATLSSYGWKSWEAGNL